MLPQLNVFFPGKLVFANGCIENISAEIKALDAKVVFIVTIEPLVSVIDKYIVSLQQTGVTVHINTSITQEPYFSDFENILAHAASLNPDVVIGIGGGSVLDIAKLVAAQLDNEQTLRDYVGIGLLKGRKKKLICIPTTSGTGSEVSPNAILVDNEDNQKKGIISPYLVPDIVFVDPLLTISLPSAITAATGMDALTHCLEAYTNKFAQPFIDLFALEGIRLIAGHIETAVTNGTDVMAREKVAMGSLLGGFCLGPVNTAAVHALSYPLGSLYHLSHGLSNALLLPYVMEFNIVGSEKRYAEVATALGCAKQATDQLTALAGVEKIKQLNAACGIPATLKEVGVEFSSLEQMAKDAMKIQRLLKNNPREVTEALALEIFKKAF
jgi:alcohol dehydrogenase class IV